MGFVGSNLQEGSSEQNATENLKGLSVSPVSMVHQLPVCARDTSTQCVFFLSIPGPKGGKSRYFVHFPPETSPQNTQRLCRGCVRPTEKWGASLFLGVAVGRLECPSQFEEAAAFAGFLPATCSLQNIGCPRFSGLPQESFANGCCLGSMIICRGVSSFFKGSCLGCLWNHRARVKRRTSFDFGESSNLEWPALPIPIALLFLRVRCQAPKEGGSFQEESTFVQM